MFVIMMAVFTALFGTAMYYGGSSYVELSSKLATANNQLMVPMLASDVDDYLKEKGTFPVSCEALMSTNGFNNARSYDGSLCSDPNGLNMKPGGWSGYASSDVTISDGIWQFNRAVVYALPNRSMSASWNAVATGDSELNTKTSGKPLFEKHFLSSALNSCGTGNFFSGVNWCGNKTSINTKIETRKDYASMIVNQRIRQNRTLQKMVGYYNKHHSFPPPAPSALSVSLTSLAGTSATATTCNGVFKVNQIPYDCADLFSLFGSNVVYNVISGNHIRLTSISDFKTSAGNPVVVSTDLSLE